MFKVDGAAQGAEYDKDTADQDRTGNNQPRVDTEINKPGGAKFTVQSLSEKATTDNLRMYNRVIIEKKNVAEFTGYIENLSVGLDTIEITCIGMLGFFNKRLYSGSFIAGGGGAPNIDDAIYQILNDTNTLDASGITQGTSTITGTIQEIEFKRSQITGAWVKLLGLINGEMEINTNRQLDLKPLLGTDKSSSIILRYESDKIAMSNVNEFQVDVEGKDMTNWLIGIRKGGATSTGEDTLSIDTFGRIEKTQNFSETNNATDLQNEIDTYIINHSEEFYSPKITVNTAKIDVDDIKLGDKVQVLLDNGFINYNNISRVIKRQITLSDNNEEILAIDLMPETVNLLPSTFIVGDIVDLEQRMSLLESDL